LQIRLSRQWRQWQAQQPDSSPLLPPLPRPAVSVFLYALLTVLFTLAGLAYIIIPK
jgi:hypothetical protein